MHPLEKEIYRRIVQDRLIRKDEQRIIVGVSGGPDSTALLYILHHLQAELGLSLVAAYVNHGLRKQEASDEKRFVFSICKKNDIVFETMDVEVRKYAHINKLSLEHAAREQRYSALRKIKMNQGASSIALGHTADDQAEEILIRLLRGSGRKGLSGMKDRSDDIVRPLLSIEKEKIFHYLKEKGIPYCVDSSNSDMRFLRNRIRHRLIPYLESNFDKGIRRAVYKTAETLAEDEKVLDEMAEDALKHVLVSQSHDKDISIPVYKLNRQKIISFPPAIQRRVIEKFLWMLGSEAKYSHILQIVCAAQKGTTGTEIHLSKGLRVGVQREYLEFLYPKGKSSWRGKLYD